MCEVQLGFELRLTSLVQSALASILSTLLLSILKKLSNFRVETKVIQFLQHSEQYRLNNLDLRTYRCLCASCQNMTTSNKKDLTLISQIVFSWRLYAMHASCVRMVRTTSQVLSNLSCSFIRITQLYPKCR